MITPTCCDHAPASRRQITPRWGSRWGLTLGLAFAGAGSLAAQTTFVGSWEEWSHGTIWEVVGWYTEEPSPMPGHRIIYAPQLIPQLNGQKTTLEGWRLERETSGSGQYLSTQSDNHWSNPNVWSSGRPTVSTDAHIINSQDIVLPDINQDAAVARSLSVFATGDGNQSVRLIDGTLNLTPLALGESLRVGVASAGGQVRFTQLTLEAATVTSSGLATIGRDGATVWQSLYGTLSLTDSSRWFHAAGLIEVGGGDGYSANQLSGVGRLKVGNGSILAGSLLPGVSLDPQVVVATGSSFQIETGGLARLTELKVSSIHDGQNAGLVVAGSLETKQLTLGETRTAVAILNSGSNSRLGAVAVDRESGLEMMGATAQADSIRMGNGIIKVGPQVVKDVGGMSIISTAPSHLTIGTPNPNDPYVRVLTMATEAGTTAGLTVDGSDVTVHGRAVVGYAGTGTVTIQNGGLVDIHGNATIGHSDSVVAGTGTLLVTGAGSLFRAQSIEAGYSYFDTYSYNPYPSPSANLTIGQGGRIEIAGFSQEYGGYGYNYETGQYERKTAWWHYGGEFTLGAGGTLDISDGTGRVVFQDPSNGGELQGRDWPEGAARFTNYGTIKGGGTAAETQAQIDLSATGGTLFNYGTIDVGHSPGWLTVNGNVKFQNSMGPGGRLLIELGGTRAGSEYDVFEVWGNADFRGGTLVLNLINGYRPKAGDFFDFLRVSGGITGWFSEVVNQTGLELNFNELNPTAGGSWFRLSTGPVGGGGSVPDGGATFALLGVALAGLGLLRRRA